MRLFSALLFALILQFPMAQNLLPSIGQFSQPQDSDPICYFPVTLDSTGFSAPGPEVGDTVPDFTLYDMADNPHTLSDKLGLGKYILLISGSYTCPVFRNKVPSINNVVANYSLDVSTYVIYEMEAHPWTDTSIYFGYVNPGSANMSAGILFDQPTTYGQRKDMVDTMNTNLVLNAPVLLDGPCNEFLSYFGPAPNNAYLIDTNGIIVMKHGWYDKLPLSIVNDLDSTLTGSSSGQNGTNGTFTFALDADSVAYGTPGAVLDIYGTFTNTSLTDDVVIQIDRQANNLPDQTWTSAMCIDACMGTNVSQYTLQMPPNSTQEFIFHFFTGSAAIGDAHLVFTNQNDPQNVVEQNFYGNTTTSSLDEVSEPVIALYPNPVDGALQVSTQLPVHLDLYSLSGELLQEYELDRGSHELNLGTLAAGVYLVKCSSESGNTLSRIVVK